MKTLILISLLCISFAPFNKGVVVSKGIYGINYNTIERMFFKESPFNGIYYVKIVNSNNDTLRRYVSLNFWDKVKIGDTINLIKEKHEKSN